MRTDERREQLLNAGVGLLAGRPHQDISIEEIADAAGVSKGLLYHYFPTKKDFILAALDRGQIELAERLQPDISLPPEQQLIGSIDAFLDYVEEHTTAYVTIFKVGGEDPEIAEALEAGRRETLATLLAGLRGWDESPVSTEPSAALETAAQGWLFFVEGAVLRWLEHGDLDRRQLRTMLVTAFVGALYSARAAGAPGPAEG
ncbi:MAG TPA: TetR/AcrR family transcriptional regulator [Solirubrobacterales bacterium]|jgi:AcrR family transcriptional regulator